jgi:DinB family protein
MLAQGDRCVLAPVDREAGFPRFADWSLPRLLARFVAIRASNLRQLEALVTGDDLRRRGVHPTFGDVTLRQLLATWVVHDLNHFHQIVKTMAKQYADAIGPWREFLPIVDLP